MIGMTPIDAAHAAMQDAPEDGALRLAFFERLADGELFLMLAGEATGARIRPEVFDLDEGRFALAFDREERLSAFAGDGRAYAAMSGRTLARMLAGQGIGLGLNLEVAPSAILLPASALDWLADTMAPDPAMIEARIVKVSAPVNLPQTLLKGLDVKLALAAGLAQAAYLVSAQYGDGGRGHLLGFVDALAGAEDALARATGEALAFSGIEAGALDVGFFAAADPVAAKLARAGLRFDLPTPEPPAAPRVAPGRDPDRPPKLR